MNATRQAELHLQLVKLLQEQYAQWHVQRVEVAGTGLESCVFRVETATEGTLAIRVPWERTSSNPNDEDVDGRCILKKERLLSQTMYEHGIRVPKPIALHLGDDDLNFLVTEFVDNDGSEPDPVELGQMLRRMHEVPVPVHEGQVQIWRGSALHQHLCERLVRRTNVVARLTGRAFRLPSEQAIRDVLQTAETAERVLHMDLRPSNLLTRGGILVGIIDWSNSMFGHPALDLARMDEYGHLTEAVVKGYGKLPFAAISKCAELLYRLDTVTMLAVVFLAEAPDPELAKQQTDRLQELHHLLKQEW